jgi:hypothetical protein
LILIDALSNHHLVDRKASAKDRENDQRHQIEQENAYFVNAHPGVVKGIELITGQAKPPAVKTQHQIVCKNEYQEPYK